MIALMYVASTASKDVKGLTWGVCVLNVLP